MKIRRSHFADCFMDALKAVTIPFCIATAMLVILSGLWALLMDSGAVIYARDLLRFPLFAFAGVLPSFMYVFVEVVTVRGRYAAMAIQTILVVLVVSGTIRLFGGIINAGVLPGMVIFLIIFVLTMAYHSRRQRKIADEINKRINAFRNSENATHR